VQSNFSVAAHWPGGFDEPGLQRWAEQLRRQLPQPTVSLGLVFMAPGLFAKAAEVLELLRVHGRIPLLVGCSSPSLIAGNQEIEHANGLVLGLYHLPGAVLHATHFTQDQLQEIQAASDWYRLTGLAPAQCQGWLAWADPYRLDCEAWLDSWNRAYPALPVVGGLVLGSGAEHQTQLYLNGEVFEEGAVAVSVQGQVRLESVLAQGCTPIGDSWTITQVERNLIVSIANRPAYEVLAETYHRLPASEQQKTRGNLVVGLAANEYQEEFRQGDFLVRNLIGADLQTGILAVGAFPRVGQTLQFHRRDPEASSQAMVAALSRARQRLAGRRIYGGCLCSCAGRGRHLFGQAHHDARQVQRHLGPMGLVGCFCNGEIGPVGDKNFVHGYTASLGLFVRAA
jgi:small ligand-binding sensory domain FIST